MELQESVSEVTQEIEKTFPDVRHLDADKIASHECLECERVTSYFRGKTWKELDAVDLYTDDNLARCLSLLTPAASHFFLPFFLIASLEIRPQNPSRLSARSASVRESVIFHLTPPSAESEYRKWEDRVRIFSQQQGRVIAVFLRFLRMEVYLEERDEQLDRALRYFSSRFGLDSNS